VNPDPEFRSSGLVKCCFMTPLLDLFSGSEFATEVIRMVDAASLIYRPPQI